MIYKLLKFFRVSKRDNCDRYYLLQVAGFGIFLHRLHTDEEKDLLHNHPWPYFSIIFGCYREELLPQDGYEVKRTRWFFNCAKSKTYHRIELPRGPVWSLLFHARRNNEWSVINKNGQTVSVCPWRGIGGPTSYKGNK